MRHHPLSFLGGFLAGMCAMYYLDAQSGRQRRALVRDQMVSAGHGVADVAQAKARHAMHQARGLAATHLHPGGGEPGDDHQLHERIRSRLGRCVSHPKAVQVEVAGGCVCLRGDILRREVDALVTEVQAMPGVTELRNELRMHDSPEGVSALQGGAESRTPAEQSAGVFHH